MLSHGASKDGLEHALATLLDVLDRPRSRVELAELLARRLGGSVRSRAGGTGWGNRAKTPWIVLGGVGVPIGYALHLAGARGAICLGPARGSEATYVRADAWVHAWSELAQDEAEVRLLERYLRSFGPATPRDFAIWTGMTHRDAQEIWSRASTRLAPVNFEGEEAWVLRSDLRALASSSLGETSVRLLPHFDSYLLGHRDHRNVVEDAHRPRVYRGQGWVSPVVLLDGRVAGVWTHSAGGGVLTIRVRSFVPLPRPARAALREEARSMAEFLGHARGEVILRRG
jgi:hypothetical protein